MSPGRIIPLRRRIALKLGHMLRNNFIADRYFDKHRRRVLNASFLSSPEYGKMFLKSVPDVEEFLAFTDDAEQETPNFNYRHHHLNKILGAWRWKPLFLHHDKLVPIIFDPNVSGIDFGGAGGPVSMHSTIVDFGAKDIFNRPITYRGLDEVDFSADYIYSSHAIEHITELPEIISQFYSILKPGGDLILVLPSYTCNRWRAGLHTSKKFSDHKWTFKLSQTQVDEEIPKLLDIDLEIERLFDTIIKEYSGDNSILIHARKPKAA